MTPRYEPHEIEAKWQRVWEDEGAFRVPNPEPGAPTTKECPFCASSISIKAKRCPQCTSQIT